MTITFSAGNEGIDANANGVIDNDSIGSPATAKNVITIGASENDRQGNYQCDTSLTYQSHDAYQPGTTCSGMGGQNILGTYGVRWPADYPANPIADDPTAGNAAADGGVLQPRPDRRRPDQARRGRPRHLDSVDLLGQVPGRLRRPGQPAERRLPVGWLGHAA